jgi:hypothetical protein
MAAELPSFIDFRPVKAEVARRYAERHPLRVVVEAQPDFTPRPEGLVRLEMLFRFTMAIGKDQTLRCPP